MANSEEWDIKKDNELEAAVREETHYGTNRLSDSDLKGNIKSAKRVLSLKAGVTSFYDDRGIAVALLGVTCAKAKGAVENSPVRVKDTAGQNITLRTSDGSSIQIDEYNDMLQTGLAESDATDVGTQEIHLTRTFLSDSSSQ